MGSRYSSDSIDYKQLGNNLKRLRIERGITQKDVSSEIEVSVVHVSHVENAVSYPSLGLLADLALLYDVSFDELLKDTYGTKSNKKNKNN